MKTQVENIRTEIKRLEQLKDNNYQAGDYTFSYGDAEKEIEELDNKINSAIENLANQYNLTFGDILEAVYNDEVLQLIISDLKLTEEEVKPLHRFRVRSIEMILNNIKENGFASVFYPYNYIRDIKQHYGINLKVDECHRIVYDN